MWIARDLIVELHYKLSIFGVKLYRPYNVVCDNQVLVNNMSLPQYSLGNKHNEVNYHVVCEAST